MSDIVSNPYDREAVGRAVNHVPPHSLQLERAVLGLMLLSPDTIDEIIASDLRPAVFYSPPTSISTTPSSASTPKDQQSTSSPSPKRSAPSSSRWSTAAAG